MARQATAGPMAKVKFSEVCWYEVQVPLAALAAHAGGTPDAAAQNRRLSGRAAAPDLADLLHSAAVAQPGSRRQIDGTEISHVTAANGPGRG